MKVMRGRYPEAEEPAEMQTEQAEGFCRLCKQPVFVVIPSKDNLMLEEFKRLASLAYHDACVDAMRGREKAAFLLRHEQERMSTWLTICPPEFQKAIDWKKTKGAGKHYKTIMEWKPGAPGLRLEGVTGHCKTRFIFKLLEREYGRGMKVALWQHTRLRETFSALASNDSPRLLQYVRQLAKLDMLVIDDLGKGKSTGASEEAFFDLVDRRYRDSLPMFYTLNGDLELVMLNVSEEFREPLRRRIEETTRLITL